MARGQCHSFPGWTIRRFAIGSQQVAAGQLNPVANGCVMALAFFETNASVPWTNVSTLTCAVIAGGTVRVSSSSTMEMCGTRCASIIRIFTRRCVSVLTAALVVSLPVPAVVGMKIRGRPRFGILP